jgi:DNA-binding response OmpR family regulator
MIKVLLIDDDLVGSLAIKIGLETGNDFVVKWLKGSIDGFEESLCGDWDVILLDVNMSHLNGFEFLRTFRLRNTTTPVIMITVRSKESDMLMGFELGVDDYIFKPFSLKVLKARILSIFRRFNTDTREIVYKNVTLNLDSKKVYCGVKAFRLNFREFNLLKILVLEPSRVHTREILLDRLWGYDSSINERTVDTLITRVRKKLKEMTADFSIKSIRGIGYSLEE